jgi:hypothetical protein
MNRANISMILQNVSLEWYVICIIFKSHEF